VIGHHHVGVADPSVSSGDPELQADSRGHQTRSWRTCSRRSNGGSDRRVRRLEQAHQRSQISMDAPSTNQDRWNRGSPTRRSSRGSRTARGSPRARSPRRRRPRRPRGIERCHPAHFRRTLVPHQEMEVKLQRVDRGGRKCGRKRVGLHALGHLHAGAPSGPAGRTLAMRLRGGVAEPEIAGEERLELARRSH